LLAVVVAEQEREAGQVDAKLGRVLAVDADEATERGGELAVIGSGEPAADEGEYLGKFGGVAGVELNAAHAGAPIVGIPTGVTVSWLNRARRRVSARLSARKRRVRSMPSISPSQAWVAAAVHHHVALGLQPGDHPAYCAVADVGLAGDRRRLRTRGTA